MIFNKWLTHPAGLEPATLGSEDRCSVQLSYQIANAMLDDGAEDEECVYVINIEDDEQVVREYIEQFMDTTEMTGEEMDHAIEMTQLQFAICLAERCGVIEKDGGIIRLLQNI